jgi:hypothetical protein
MDQAAAELGLEPLGSEEVATVLRLARDVAHGVERRAAPVAAYLAGLAVGMPGSQPERAAVLTGVAGRLSATVPPPDPGEPGRRDG